MNDPSQLVFACFVGKQQTLMLLSCGVIIEDEANFILKCKVNQNLRESLFNNIELDNKNIFLNYSDEQKLVYLLNPASVRHVRVIGFYLKRSLELRTEVLLQHK